MNFLPFVFSHNLLYTIMCAQYFYSVTYKDSFYGFRRLQFNSLETALAFVDTLLRDRCSYVTVEQTINNVIRHYEDGQLLIDYLPD